MALTVCLKIRPVLRDTRDAWAISWVIVSLVAAPVSATDQPVTAALSPAVPKSWELPLSPDQKILQLLNRITFGPRPGDVDRVRQMGAEEYLDEQLHPERIEDPEADAKVVALPTLSMSTEELAENFQEMKAERRERKLTRSLGAGRGAELGRQNGSQEPLRRPESSRPMQSEMNGVEGPRRVIMELAQEEVLRAVYSRRQLQEVMVQFWMNHFNIFAPKGAGKWLTTSFERDTIRPRAFGKFEDLLVATAKSPAMLFYLDNWLSSATNSRAAGRSPEQWRRRAPIGGRVFRPWGPYGMGRRGPFGEGEFGRRPVNTGSAHTARANKRGKAGKLGLNENYARELMELHSMGVDGGYTQNDVIEVARCLTGWTIDRPRKGGGFIFNPQRHDFGGKVVLGHKIHAGCGIEDGLEVLHVLAQHPSTASFISLKLCRRFIADDPPKSAVERASNTFLDTGGDIRAVLRTILSSPEVYSQAAYRAKVKSPLELVASSLRALNAETDVGLPLLEFIARMGQPMFQYQAPAGFPDRAATWINSGSLLMRMKFAVALASGRIPGTTINWDEVTPERDVGPPSAALAALDERLLAGTLAPETHQAILNQLATGNVANRCAGLLRPASYTQSSDERGCGSSAREVRSLAALVLASPDFGKR